MIEQSQKTKPVEYKLLIEFIFKNLKKFPQKGTCLIQNKPFKFGLRIKNIDDKTTPEATIKNLTLISAENGQIEYDKQEKFTVNKLNPENETHLWWPEATTSIIKGQAWIKCDVIPTEKEIIFRTYQLDKGSKKPQLYTRENHWGQDVLIRGELEQQQARTNILIVILTLLVFFEGVWGLDKIVKTILNIIGWLFLKLGTLLV